MKIKSYEQKIIFKKPTFYIDETSLSKNKFPPVFYTLKKQAKLYYNLNKLGLTIYTNTKHKKTLKHKKHFKTESRTYRRKHNIPKIHFHQQRYWIGRVGITKNNCFEMKSVPNKHVLIFDLANNKIKLEGIKAEPYWIEQDLSKLSSHEIDSLRRKIKKKVSFPL